MFYSAGASCTTDDPPGGLRRGSWKLNVVRWRGLAADSSCIGRTATTPSKATSCAPKKPPGCASEKPRSSSSWTLFRFSEGKPSQNTH